MQGPCPRPPAVSGGLPAGPPCPPGALVLAHSCICLLNVRISAPDRVISSLRIFVVRLSRMVQYVCTMETTTCSSWHAQACTHHRLLAGKRAIQNKLLVYEVGVLLGTDRNISVFQYLYFFNFCTHQNLGFGYTKHYWSVFLTLSEELDTLRSPGKYFSYNLRKSLRCCFCRQLITSLSMTGSSKEPRKETRSCTAEPRTRHVCTWPISVLKLFLQYFVK